MTQWYVKQLSQLTKISVQTLHHYDRIGLLKPSVRLSNGYRLYSERDLSKLQQIIALKFFGFELSQIKLLLNKDLELLKNCADQAQLLEEKGQLFLRASEALKNIIAECQHDKSIHWDKTIALIEVYHMTQELEKTWAGKAFNKEELHEYAEFEKDFKQKMSKDERENISKEWDKLIADIQENLDVDPYSDFGVEIGKRCMDWVNKVYGKEFITLRNAVWEKGFKGGHLSEEMHISPEVIQWLDKAMDAYHRKRFWNILQQIGKKDDAVVKKEWDNLLNEVCGNHEESKQEVNRLVLNEDASDEIKTWIRKYYKVS